MYIEDFSNGKHFKVDVSPVLKFQIFSSEEYTMNLHSKAYKAYIGLGSNQNDPEKQFDQAVLELDALPKTQLVDFSTCYWSQSLRPEQPNFLNAVACIITALAPLTLLTALQAIEKKHGRIRTEHWGQRTLDLDLLLYSNCQMKTKSLTLPHPEMFNRDFVLRPLAEITPTLVLPDGQTLQILKEACPTRTILGASTYQTQIKNSIPQT